MRCKNTLTLPQNGGNRVSEDLKFQNSPGENAPGPPYRGTACVSTFVARTPCFLTVDTKRDQDL